MNYIIYKVVKTVVKPLFKILYRPTVIGIENIPKEGSVILAGNHKSNFDAATMLYGPKRIVHMMAKKELFKTKLSNWFFRSMAAIPVDRKSKDQNAKNSAIEILNENKVLGIFPEGTTNKTIGTKNEVDLLPFKYGAVSFASKTNTKIVPFAICGKYKMFKEKIYIIYGKPYEVGADLEKENQKLTEKVRKLKIKGDEIYEKQRKRKQ